MNRTLLVLILFSSISCSQVEENKKVELPYAYTECLVEPEQLFRELSGENGFKVIDLRKPEDYAKGHLPEALNIWRNQITDTINYSYAGMMPTKSRLAQFLGTLGISATDTIIIYDNKANCDAARLWWIMKFYGHEHVKLLNGGLKSWEALGYALSTQLDTTHSEDYVFQNPIDSSLYASAEMVGFVQADSSKMLLDTRGLEEFSGAKLKKGAASAGHIETALNVDWAEAVDYNGNHKFLPASTLKKKFDAIGITGENTVVSYCHSGVRSAHTLFVLTELLGYKNIRNYDGSWTEWSHLNQAKD